MKTMKNNLEFEEFARRYFAHYLSFAEKSKFHHYVFDVVVNFVNDKKGGKMVIAAPRGEAKTTLITQILVLWLISNNRFQFIVIIMATLDLATEILEGIKYELENNELLASDFAYMTGKGKIWKKDSIITANDIKVKIAGADKKLRGLRHKEHRPELVILDDLENDKSVLNKKNRDNLEHWLYKTVLNLGYADGSLKVVFVGTILHSDSVLARCLKSRAWKGKVFSVIESFPTNMDLWSKWEAIYKSDASQGDAFYSENKEKMHEGVELSWAIRNLYDVMKMKLEHPQAFYSELQNKPMEGGWFKNITYFDSVDATDGLILASHDPSLGKKDRSSSVVGLLRGGEIYVLEALIGLYDVETQLKNIAYLEEKYSPLVWAIESVQFQDYFADEAGKFVRNVHKYKSKQKKEVRLASLIYPINNGKIRFQHRHTLLLEELRDYPTSTYDDGIDSLAMLLEMGEIYQKLKEKEEKKEKRPTIKPINLKIKYEGY